jgi:benzoyl-CoA reductase/2-hydroxyglutaryl-CoA dehydratase subunit BcrC/BadD/HgdB
MAPASAPLKGLPRPDLLVCCTNICGTVLKWYEALSTIYDAPLFVLDVPFQRQTPAEDHILAYVEAQMEELARWLRRHTRRRLPARRFAATLALARQAVSLWQEILSYGRHRPSPINAPDLFIAMAPVVALRGTREAISLYQHMEAELADRVARGIAAVPGERYRLLWDNIAIWHRLYRFFRPFTRAGACFVADTYTNAWTVPFDPGSGLTGLARAYTGVFINLDLPERLATIRRLAEQFGADGMVMHANRSCKPFSLTQHAVRDDLRRLGLPVLILEADMADSRAYNEGSVRERVAAFLETLEAH